MKKNKWEEARSTSELTHTCGNCQFFKPDITLQKGDCRRYPPTLLAEISSDKGFDSVTVGDVYSYNNTCWPEVKIQDWCGEFTKKT